MPPELRIGSRPSPLALAQAAIVQARLTAIMPGLAAEIVPIQTSGDRMTSAALAQVGGKGLFIKELEQALAERRIDIAVHSMKDLPAILPAGFIIAAVSEREDPRDVLVTRVTGGLGALAHGARVGTSSARRKLEILRLRPDLEIGPLRGNIDTRLERLARGELDAIILAIAGLKRLARIDGLNLEALDPGEFIPAAGQGALAIETLADAPGPARLSRALADLSDPRAAAETAAERAFLAGIGASCVSPVGAHATLEGATLSLRARLFSLDGAKILADSISQPFDPASPAEAGAELARRMLKRGAAALIKGD